MVAGYSLLLLAMGVGGYGMSWQSAILATLCADLGLVVPIMLWRRAGEPRVYLGERMERKGLLVTVAGTLILASGLIPLAIMAGG